MQIFLHFFAFFFALFYTFFLQHSPYLHYSLTLAYTLSHHAGCKPLRRAAPPIGSPHLYSKMQKNHKKLKKISLSLAYIKKKLYLCTEF